MKLLCAVFLLLFAHVAIVFCEDNNLFVGSWCISDEQLIITFTGGDSIDISSNGDASIKGSGSYNFNDTLLTTTIINDDLTMEMGYRYKKKSSYKLKAKIIFFTIDGDSVAHPRRWLTMEKCDPKTYQFHETSKDNE